MVSGNMEYNSQSFFNVTFIQCRKVFYVTKLVYHLYKLILHILRIPVLNHALPEKYTSTISVDQYVSGLTHASLHIPELIPAQNIMPSQKENILATQAL